MREGVKILKFSLPSWLTAVRVLEADLLGMSPVVVLALRYFFWLKT